MIWLPNEEEEKIYQAVGMTIKDFGRIEMCSKNQINSLEYVFMPEWTENRRRAEIQRCTPYESFYQCDSSEVLIGLSSRKMGNAHEQTILKYYHPLYLAMRAYDQVRNSREVVELLGFFEQFVDYNTERELEALKKAKKIITSLDASSIDSETFKTSIQMMWPVFGYFATEIFEHLEITPLENGKVHTFDEIATIQENLDFCHQRGIIIDENQKNQYNEILKANDQAKYNKQVLSLARKVNERSKK